MLQSVLNDASQKTKDNEQLNQVIYTIMKSRIKDTLDAATRLAIKRSGVRGRVARKEQVRLEKVYADFCELNPQTYVTAEMTNDVVTEVFEKMELIDEDERRNRAQKILKGLGFTDEQTVQEISIFSGGWRMKIALAKSLFMRPDILLLDEPTNHLDLHAILWLQEYVLNDMEDLTVVVVSHDREFLNLVTDETIIMKDKTLKYHAGNYEDWERNTEEQKVRKQTLLDVSNILAQMHKPATNKLYIGPRKEKEEDSSKYPRKSSKGQSNR